MEETCTASPGEVQRRIISNAVASPLMAYCFDCNSRVYRFVHAVKQSKRRNCFWSMMVFSIMLTNGIVYEWRKGALDWS